MDSEEVFRDIDCGCRRKSHPGLLEKYQFYFHFFQCRFQYKVAVCGHGEAYAGVDARESGVRFLLGHFPLATIWSVFLYHSFRALRQLFEYRQNHVISACSHNLCDSGAHCSGANNTYLH
jgi:hypothetical protein